MSSRLEVFSLTAETQRPRSLSETVSGGLAKRPARCFFVIPADPGSGPGQAPESRKTTWIPAFAGMTVGIEYF
jgi:hypothetical protein